MNVALMFICLTGSAALAQPDVVYRDGNVSIRDDYDFINDKGNSSRVRRLTLMQNRIALGTNYEKPDRGGLDRTRVPTTYYHTRSPIGVVLKKYDWFPGKENTYHADIRMPATMVGFALQPFSQLVALWAEPPLASIGLDIGTIASYARPGQMIDFFEHEPRFVKLSWPSKDGGTYFHFAPDAAARGALLRLFEGEPREQMEKRGGIGFYQVIHINTFKLPVVTLHKGLMTVEGMRVLMDRTREDGILCYHTSNRYYDLNPIVTNVARELGFATLQGRDDGDRDRDPWRWSSDWIMVARNHKYLAHLKPPPDDKPPGPPEMKAEPFWQQPKKFDKRFVWTDKGENSFAGLYRSDPVIGEFTNMLGELEAKIFNMINVRDYYRYTNPLHQRLHQFGKSRADEWNRAFENGGKK